MDTRADVSNDDGATLLEIEDLEEVSEGGHRFFARVQGEKWWAHPGKWFNNWLISTSLGTDVNIGPTGSTRRPTNGAHGEEGDSPHPRRGSIADYRLLGGQLTPHLQILSWNASGLSSAMFQEFMAWCDTSTDLDAIIIQETHWHDTSDFYTGPWLAMHTSGRHTTEEHGRCSGILFLLHRRRFQDPRLLDILPGRLALVQATSKTTQLPVSIIGVYQHVWRSHLTTARNLELRRNLWEHLDRQLLLIPQRHHLLICGDFNSTVSPDPPVVGCSVLKGTTQPDSDLSALLHKHSLSVLNTWNTRAAGTFYSPQGHTQIDYIITRQRTAHLQAKSAHPDHAFPVGGGRLSGHYPIRAQLPLQTFRSSPSQDGPAVPTIDLTALQTAVCQASPEAQAMQASVAQRLQQVDVTNLASTHKHVNRILLEAAAAAFPRQPVPDNRVSAQPAFRISASSVWQLYHDFKKPRACTPWAIFTKWKLAAAFARASKALRKQSHRLKKQFYESQVDLAEQAALRSDQRSLFLIIKRLSPKSRNIACRLRGDDGRLLNGPEQLQHIVAYGNKTFAAKDDDPPSTPLLAAPTISAQDLTAEFGKLGLSKAVPRHIAPAAVWKLCSHELGVVLSQALTHHLQPGNLGELDEDWKSSYVVWIPKPGKPQLDVSSLRPIGLSSPASKALAGSLRHHLLRGLEPALRMTPQFAYAKHRGTADALLRAHMHFEAVAKLVQDTQCTRFQKQAGGRERSAVGGLGLSLDLSKAFDGVTRAHLYRSMAQHGVPPDIITIIQQLHFRAQYVYQVGQHTGYTTTSNGIKQGCVIAPYLWNYFSLAFLSMLREHRDEAWIRQVLTLFADDVWGAWELRTAQDLTRAVADISLILETLETLDMTINYNKTAILFKLVGKDAKRLRQEHTFMKAGQLHLKLIVHGRECGIPIKEQHEYLGTIVTYRHRLQRNMQHRLKTCTARYQGLRKLLNGSHHLAVHHRLRLWQACICTSAMYAQHIVGVTSSTLAALTVTLTRHLRAILRIPAHLTHVTTGEVWRQAALPMPGWMVQTTQQHFLSKLIHHATHSPDITTTTQVMEHLKRQAARLDATLMEAAAGLAKAPPQTPAVSCPFCQETFVTENAMRVHCGLKHESKPQHSTRTPTVFRPELHSKAGMPACQLCERQFWRWAHLVAHIESGACKCLGGDSAVRAPLPADNTPADIKLPPTAGLGLFEEENAPNMPLVRRSAFQRSLDSWEKWLQHSAVRLELTQHCVLCHFWVADFRHMKQHLNKAHPHEMTNLLPGSLSLCASFKSQLRRGSGCIVLPLLTARMYGHEQDFAINEEAAIFANCWPAAPEFLLSPTASLSPDHRSQKRPRPNQPPRWPGQRPPSYQGHRGHPFGSSSYGPSRPPHHQDPLRLLTRVVLQQEQTISRLRHDKGFVLFMRQGEDGTLGALMRVAKEWNSKKSQADQTVRSPLRTVLLSSMVSTLLKLAQQAVATEENKQKMITAEWLTTSSEWTYRTWNPSERRLVVDTTKSPLQHAEIVRILNYLLEHLTGEAIQRFNSTVTLPKLEQQGANIATFALEVSLRGQAAAEIYRHFERLCGSAIMSLIGVSMKKDTLPQTPAAKQLANLFYQRHR
ncbi:RNA-directed DNA polymerase from mobile element jockey [Symbiodinium microadriaticum]|uniref:RNA-directed DNA polymerase from mobile element jockey n=1 Tax=Symbiodinium microadriaticum TaxID=2951 RepID=A0A1Q9EEV8_SYMMI|nr:RNA-directed DNA polymerase from mobile element jockey [Symbiodinium microadriaticum]